MTSSCRKLSGLLALSALGAAFVTASLEAGEISGELRVSATVIARALLVADGHPAEITVTEDDARRGVVTVPATVVTRTNDGAGIQILFHPMSHDFDGITVACEGGELVLEGSESRVVRPFVSSAPHETSLVYQLALRQGTKAGVYPWPVRLEVRPASQ